MSSPYIISLPIAEAASTASFDIVEVVLDQTPVLVNNVQPPKNSSVIKTEFTLVEKVEQFVFDKKNEEQVLACFAVGLCVSSIIVTVA